MTNRTIPPSSSIGPTGQLRRRIGKKWSTYPRDVLPAWVADMDFAPMPAVMRTMREAVALGDLGYPPTSERSGVPEAFSIWARDRWNWNVDPASTHLIPEVVTGLDNCIEALTVPGDSILVQTPIYPAFLRAIKDAHRRLITTPLVEGVIDFDHLRKCLSKNRIKMLLLCNPHNPTGRVFSDSELRQLAALAIRHDLLIVSDEVHGDLAYRGHRHIPFASLGDDVIRRTITLTSASKAFNISGLRLGLCVVPDRGLRRRLLALPINRRGAYGTLGVRATVAVWSAEGQKWNASLMLQLDAIRTLTQGLISKHLPQVQYRAPEAGYLAWLDCRAMRLEGEPAEFFLERARVALSAGREFGRPGKGHVRLNFATSPSLLRRVIERMGHAAGSAR